MGKYNSTFYNSERYYDPTAGAALVSIIREEKRKHRDFTVNRKSTDFAKEFAEFYSGFGLRENGKPKRLAQHEIVYGYIRIYNYCMAHANDDDFSIENTVKKLRLGTDRRVQQVFSGRGNMGKLIKCYNNWLQTGKIEWGKK